MDQETYSEQSLAQRRGPVFNKLSETVSQGYPGSSNPKQWTKTS